MIATAYLNNEIDEKDKPFRDIKSSAKHEALHLLLARLEVNGTSRFVLREDIDEASEELVHKLEDLIQ